MAWRSARHSSAPSGSPPAARGASSTASTVRSQRCASIPSGIDCCGQVDLVPVDIDGRRVESVELDPSTVRVQIDVSTLETSRTVPIRPLVTGAPAAGFEVGTVTAEPSVVTLRGSPEVLAAIGEILTEPISLAGSNATLRATGTLVLPDGARLADPAASEPTIVVQIRETVGTRTLAARSWSAAAPRRGAPACHGSGRWRPRSRGTVSDLDALDPGGPDRDARRHGARPGGPPRPADAWRFRMG